MFAFASVSHCAKPQIHLQNSFLRELFLLPGYKCNHGNYSSANYLHNNFVNHGTCICTPETVFISWTMVSVPVLPKQYLPISYLWAELRGSLPGCEFLVVSLKEGSGVGFRWGGVGFPVENEGKGKGVGRVGCGVGTGKGTGKSMCTRLSKLPFSKLPFSFSPISAWGGKQFMLTKFMSFFCR